MLKLREEMSTALVWEGEVTQRTRRILSSAVGDMATQCDLFCVQSWSFQEGSALRWRGACLKCFNGINQDILQEDESIFVLDKSCWSECQTKVCDVLRGRKWRQSAAARVQKRFCLYWPNTEIWNDCLFNRNLILGQRFKACPLCECWDTSKFRQTWTTSKSCFCPVCYIWWTEGWKNTQSSTADCIEVNLFYTPKQLVKKTDVAAASLLDRI